MAVQFSRKTVKRFGAAQIEPQVRTNVMWFIRFSQWAELSLAPGERSIVLLGNIGLGHKAHADFTRWKFSRENFARNCTCSFDASDEMRDIGSPLTLAFHA